jgi:hypothetical protein
MFSKNTSIIGHSKMTLPTIEEEAEQSPGPSNSAPDKISADQSSMPTYIVFYTPKGQRGLIEGFTTDKDLWEKILAKCEEDEAYQFQTNDGPNFKGALDLTSQRSIEHQP